MILRLTLKKEWFDLIKNGEKKFEYREYKQYWISRLLKDGTRNFKEVHFTNGYGAKMPLMRLEFIGISIMDGKNIDAANNEPIDDKKKYFVIGLGDVLEIRNAQ